MYIQSTEIIDTYAEAFKMWAARIIITAENEKWALAAGRSVTGFATSVIGCKCEAGIESELSADETPDLILDRHIIFRHSPKPVCWTLTVN